MTTLPHRKHGPSRALRHIGFIGALFGVSLILSSTALAVPSFSRQTGAGCSACHVGAFGPDLTPYGINFKLRGYADGSSPKWWLPLSGMVVANWTHTQSDQLPPPGSFRPNDNAVLQEISLFAAGKIANGVGAFIQGTYSGIDHYSALDQVDIRLAHEFTLGGKELSAGLSLNNNPTLTSPTNTVGAWRFPFTAEILPPRPPTPPCLTACWHSKSPG